MFLSRKTCAYASLFFKRSKEKISPYENRNIEGFSNMLIS